MNKLFTEFENENALRTYPFASGCTTADTSGVKIGTGVFIDAALYPVNPTGILYLSSVAPGGILTISDDTGPVMSARVERGNSNIEFYDLTGLARHVGTVLASSPEAAEAFSNVYAERLFKKDSTAFASSCVFPIVNDGVLSIDVGNTGSIDGVVEFKNESSDPVRVSTDGSTLRFDIVPSPYAADTESIQHIYCIVDGKTPFRLLKMPFDIGAGSSSDIGNTVAVYLDNIEKNDVCGNAHREDAYEMTDTCRECESSSCPGPEDPIEIPHTYQTAVVDIPNGAENAFYLVTPNFLGYDNPLSITMTDGETIPKTEIDITAEDAQENNLSKLTDKIKYKGAVLQVPGL